MTVAERVTGMSIEEFIRRYDEAPFEILNGHVEYMSPKVFGSDYIARLVQRVLDQYGHGEVFIETTFILSGAASGEWVSGSRQPDVLFISEGRLETYRAQTPDWKLKPLMLVPDLVVEVVSPTDRPGKVWQKAGLYLEDGVQVVWIVNPVRENVTVFTQNGDPYTLDKTETLEGGTLLPGFSLSLQTLFAD
jgi:Uma2 family endonuclease